MLHPAAGYIAVDAYTTKSTMLISARQLDLQILRPSVRGYPRLRCSSSRLYSVEPLSMKRSALFEDQSDKIKSQLTRTAHSTPTIIHPILKSSGLDGFLDGLDKGTTATWAKLNKFNAKSGEVLLVPGADGAISSVLLGINSWDDLWAYAALPGKLPSGTYKLVLDLMEVPASEASNGPARASAANKAVLGWILGCYKFTRYKTGKLENRGNTENGKQQAAAAAGSAATTAGQDQDKPLLVIPEHAEESAVFPLAAAICWCRDMINTPAEDMSPQHLAQEAEALVAAHKGADVGIYEGKELLEANYPAIHTVGRAADRPPVLIDMEWKPTGVTEDTPLLALVGKGVCFDTGGLDIKTAAGMKLMKKDMGGAALMLALAHVIMSAQLPVRLKVLVPAVENAISGNAYRPGDVLQTRSGLTVENGNTDAEGRLILCDALHEASQHKPAVLIDAATLTGAARVALGPELPAVFSSCDETWSRLEAAAKQEGDPLWRLPLWPGYRKALDSKIADIGSTGEPGNAGAITAALFLSEFVKNVPAWVHIDTAAWVSGSSTGPGRPEGGEALGLRALWQFCQERFGTADKNC